MNAILDKDNGVTREEAQAADDWRIGSQSKLVSKLLRAESVNIMLISNSSLDS